MAYFKSVREALAHLIKYKSLDEPIVMESWHLDDIESRAAGIDAKPLSTYQVNYALKCLGGNFDANVGINWDTVDDAISSAADVQIPVATPHRALGHNHENLTVVTRTRYYVEYYKNDDVDNVAQAWELSKTYVEDFRTPEERKIFIQGLAHGMDAATQCSDFTVYTFERTICEVGYNNELTMQWGADGD